MLGWDRNCVKFILGLLSSVGARQSTVSLHKLAAGTGSRDRNLFFTYMNISRSQLAPPLIF
jgi:hypothetical protein